MVSILDRFCFDSLSKVWRKSAVFEPRERFLQSVQKVFCENHVNDLHGAIDLASRRAQDSDKNRLVPSFVTGSDLRFYRSRRFLSKVDFKNRQRIDKESTLSTDLETCG